MILSKFCWDFVGSHVRKCACTWVFGRVKSLIRLFATAVSCHSRLSPRTQCVNKMTAEGVSRILALQILVSAVITLHVKGVKSPSIAWYWESLIRLWLAWTLPRGNPSTQTLRGDIYNVYVRWLSPPVQWIDSTTINPAKIRRDDSSIRRD